MSVQFGRWRFDGEPSAAGYLESVKTLLAPYGPDGGNSYSASGLDIVYQAFHTTKQSRREHQPHVTPSGAIVSWDGRLDNRADLIHQLGRPLSLASTDVDIVATSYERWTEDSFRKLIGDWALSIWNPRDESVVLAKDFIGTRHLYYSFADNQLVWSSLLDPLVLLSEKFLEIEEEYVAGWLGFFPAPYLTPYRGIYSVPPSTYVLVRRARATVHKYWDFDPKNRVRYGIDAEYEEHFRVLFAESVRRRLRSDRPVLAELSGGMDSSSIVSMADALMAQASAETPRLDTVSYYDDSEANWNEKPYFEMVEAKRGRVGCHLDVRYDASLLATDEIASFLATPACCRRSSDAVGQFAICLESNGNRVLLSGIGGDEVLGGVPTPIPELADLIAEGHLYTLVKQMWAWALAKRKPLVSLASETIGAFLPRALVRADKSLPTWIEPAFVQRHKQALSGTRTSLRIFGSLPGFQDSLSTLNALRHQLASSPLSPFPIYEQRYPLLDRDLLEFLFAVPREQLLRPEQRRSLMRRALVALVPKGVLARKRKAFVARGPAAALSTYGLILSESRQELLSASLGFVNREALAQALRDLPTRPTLSSVSLGRTLALERWLNCLQNQLPSVLGRFRDSLHSTRAASEVCNPRLLGGC